MKMEKVAQQWRDIYQGTEEMEEPVQAVRGFQPLPFIWGSFTMASDEGGASQGGSTKLGLKYAHFFLLSSQTLRSFVPASHYLVCSPPPTSLPSRMTSAWLDAAEDLKHLRKINPIVPGRFLQLPHIFPNSTLESAFTLYNGRDDSYTPSMGVGGGGGALG